MVPVYLVKNLRYGHAKVCLADRRYAMLLEFCQNYKNGGVATLLTRLPAAG